MFKHLLFKISFTLFFILLLGGAQLTAAQTPEPTEDEYPCADEALSRYEAWVKALPCLEFLPAEDASAGASSGEESILPRMPNPDANSYTYLVFSSYRDGNWEIYGSTQAWGYDGFRNVTRLTNDPAIDLMPRVRPGTSQVLFASKRTGNYELFLMDWDGGILQQLTNHSAYDSQPAWSPDGKRIAFVSDRDGNLEIYAMNADGSGLARLTNHGMDDFNPYWSPDGSKIIWVRAVNQEFGDIFRMDANGTNQRQLTPPLHYLSHPSWSKSGELIAFDYDANLDGWNDLGVMNLDGGKLHPIVAGGYMVDFLAGPWPQIGSHGLLFTRVQYVENAGNLYVQNMNIGTYDFSNGSTRLNPSGPDYYPDCAMTDNSIPESHVEKLSEYKRAGSFPITVVGSDPGVANLYALEVQYRVGQQGEWQSANSFQDINAAEVERSFDFTGLAGQALYFRSRAQDWADHWEAWPPGDGDAFTRLFAWNLWGTITDNRGIPIPHANVETQPVFTDQVNPNTSGIFHRYVPSSPVTVGIQTAGYLPPLNTQISSQSDVQYTWALSPFDNDCENGGFENGLEGWRTTGNYAVKLVSDIKHTGLAAVELCQANTSLGITKSDLSTTEWNSAKIITSALSQGVNLTADMHNPTLSFHYYSSRVGTGGSFQALINDTVVYSSSAAGSAWTHGWLDLSPWQGQSVTITFQVSNDLSQGLLTTRVDDVSVGSWLTPVIRSVDPMQVAPDTSFYLTITGENFTDIPIVWIGSEVFPWVQKLDEGTLSLQFVNGLPAGVYTLRIVNLDGQESYWGGILQVGRFIFLPVQLK